MGEMRMAFMLFLALGVAGSMYVIFRMFLKRLQRIEDDYWGPKPGKPEKADKTDKK